MRLGMQPEEPSASLPPLSCCVEELTLSNEQSAAPLAWYDPETRDVITDERKTEWATHFGLGGKKKAESYTMPLYAAATPPDPPIFVVNGGSGGGERG